MANMAVFQDRFYCIVLRQCESVGYRTYVSVLVKVAAAGHIVTVQQRMEGMRVDFIRGYLD